MVIGHVYKNILIKFFLIKQGILLNPSLLFAPSLALRKIADEQTQEPIIKSRTAIFGEKPLQEGDLIGLSLIFFHLLLNSLFRILILFLTQEK